MDLAGAGWGLQTIIGGLLLFGVLLWVVLKNRNARDRVDPGERGTRRVYDEAEDVRRRGDEDV